MKYKIIIPTALEEINPDNDNVDVLVETANGKQYSFVVATPENVKYLMKKDKIPFLKPGSPFLFVERITEANIRMLLDSLMAEPEQRIRIYGEDYWVFLDHYSLLRQGIEESIEDRQYRIQQE